MSLYMQRVVVSLLVIRSQHECGACCGMVACAVVLLVPRVEGVVRYLGQHKPWLLKDPRLAWFAPLWMERLEAPGCILIVHPQVSRTGGGGEGEISGCSFHAQVIS